MGKPVPDDVRFRVLRVLQSDPGLSQRQIAVALGVSLGAVNYCLRALTEKGQIKVRNFRSSNNKLRYAYILTPSGVAEKARLTGAFLKCKVAEYDALKAEIEALSEDISMDSGV
jgi:EPS-associated MarR family transcriptional regulator